MYHQKAIIPCPYQPPGGCLAGGRVAWRRSLTGRFISWLWPPVNAWRRGGAWLPDRPRGAGRKLVMAGSQPRCAASQVESPVRDEIRIASEGRLERGCQRSQFTRRLRAGLFGESVASSKSNVSAGRARRLHRGQGLARQRCRGSRTHISGSADARSSGDLIRPFPFSSGPVSAIHRTPRPRCLERPLDWVVVQLFIMRTGSPDTKNFQILLNFLHSMACRPIKYAKIRKQDFGANVSPIESESPCSSPRSQMTKREVNHEKHESHEKGRPFRDDRTMALILELASALSSRTDRDSTNSSLLIRKIRVIRGCVLSSSASSPRSRMKNREVNHESHEWDGPPQAHRTIYHSPAWRACRRG